MNSLRSIAAICIIALSPFASQAAAHNEARSHSAITAAPRDLDGGWGKRHESFNAIVQANQGDVDIVFIGDSITHGWEGAGKIVWEAYYANRKAVNLGIGGDRTQHVLWRLDNGNIDGIQPKVAVVMIGTNNSADDRNTAGEMIDGVRAVVEKLQSKLPETHVLLLDIFPRGHEMNVQRGKILQVNQVLNRLDDGEMIHFLQIGQDFVENDGTISKAIMPDYLHLSTAGYGIWAAAIEGKLASLLNQSPIATENADITGDWIFEMDTPDGRMQSDFTIKVVEAKVTGTLSMGPDRQFELQEGGIFKDQIAFKILRDRPEGGEMLYELKGTASENQINGTASTKIDGETITIDWVAKRKSQD